MEFTHKPVLLAECIEALHIRPEGIYVDGTLGRAGHSREIAQRLTTGRLVCIDRDQAAIDAAQERLAPWMDRVTLVHSNFSRLAEVLDDLHIDAVDGMLFDLGVSSPQLDDAERGFSYMHDAPLDMRMDRTASLTARDVVNDWPYEELRRILYEYGEERYAPLIAAAIERERADKPIETTLELVRVIKGAMPAKALREKQHPAKRSFQAIRIWVNDEFGQLVAGLAAAERALRPGGKLAVVSFHSLEDRIVKRFMQARSNSAGGGSRYAPETERIEPAFTLPFRRAIGPDEAELATNPRSRSALLRVGIRTHAPAGRVDPEALGLPVLPERGAR